MDFQQLVLIERSGTAHYENGVLTTDQIVFGFPGGWALVASPGLYDGELALSGNDINLASPGSLLPFGSGYQLTIPFSFEDDITGLNLRFSGQIVAYSTVVPEQSSSVLLLIGAACLAEIAWRRGAKRLSRPAC